MKRVELTLRGRALDLLSRREHSRAELARKLAPHTEDPAEIETLLDDFCTRGWVSDQRFTEQVVNAKAARFGGRFIAQQLRNKGVAEELIKEALPDSQDELANAIEVWRKKFGSVPENAKERARQMRFLQSRGFSFEVILKVLQQEHDESI